MSGVVEFGAATYKSRDCQGRYSERIAVEEESQ